MYTLEEIKKLVYPKESIDWVKILKELVLMKFGDNKLISFNGVYLYSVGDPDGYVEGVAVINDRLFVLASDGDDYDFGTAYFGDCISRDKGIGLTECAIKKICQLIFENKLGKSYYKEYSPIEFDFSTETSETNDWYEKFFWRSIKIDKEKFDSFVSGESCGYISI